MTPSPQIDLMIATLIMGLAADVRKPGDWPFDECRIRDADDPEDFEHWRPFSPSTRIDHAWQVVEHITRPTAKTVSGMPWNTRFAHFWDGADLWAESSAGAAARICAVALRAAGVDLPNAQE